MLDLSRVPSLHNYEVAPPRWQRKYLIQASIAHDVFFLLRRSKDYVDTAELLGWGSIDAMMAIVAKIEQEETTP